MNDPILASFLRVGYQKLLELAADSDAFAMLDVQGDPPLRYTCAFRDIDHFERGQDGKIYKTIIPIIFGIHIQPDYLRADISGHLGIRTVSVLNPVWHPNIRGHTVCLGNAFRPGTSLDGLVCLVFQVLTSQNYSTRLEDLFNIEAARYFVEHRDEVADFNVPLLTRRKINVAAQVTRKGAGT